MTRGAVFSTLLVSAACSVLGKEGEAEPEGENHARPTLDWIRSNVFAERCTSTVGGCHIQNATDGRMVLACAIDSDEDGELDSIAPTSAAELQLACFNLLSVPAFNLLEQGATRLVPGKSDESFIVRKLSADSLAEDPEGRIINCPMPFSSCTDTARLEPEVIAAIREWIDTGAPGCTEESPAEGIHEPEYWREFCETGELPTGRRDGGPGDAGASDAQVDAQAADAK